MEIVYPKYIFTPSPAFKLYIVVQKIWNGYYEVIGLSVDIYHDFRLANIYYQDDEGTTILLDLILLCLQLLNHLNWTKSFIFVVQ